MHTANDLKKLEGATVLVLPGDQTAENPAVGLRGTIHVSPSGHVTIRLEYPAMFYGRVRQQELALDREDVEQLLESETEGQYEYRVAGTIEGPETDR